ncbi:MAG: 3D domain-containing protein [Spirochaetota bacterium]
MMMHASTFQKIYMIFILLLICVFTIGGILYSGQDAVDDRIEEVLNSDMFADGKPVHMRCDITAYCPGACCNTGVKRINGRMVTIDWSDKVAVGGLSLSRMVSNGIHVMAVDPDVIPLGSIIYYEGKYYFALDTGGMIKGRKLDVLVEKHDDTFVFGKRMKQEVKIFMPQDSGKAVNYIRNILSEIAI